MEAAHEQCCELYPKISILRKELVELEEVYKKYKKKYEDADREIALAERVTKVIVQKGFKAKEPVFKGLSKKQLLELAEELKGGDNENI